MDNSANETAQKIQDLYFENGAKVSKATWDETLRLLTTHSAHLVERKKEIDHKLARLQGWLGGVTGAEIDSTLQKSTPSKEVRHAKALHTSIIMKAKEKVHEIQEFIKPMSERRSDQARDIIKDNK